MDGSNAYTPRLKINNIHGKPLPNLMEFQIKATETRKMQRQAVEYKENVTWQQLQKKRQLKIANTDNSGNSRKGVDAVKIRWPSKKQRR